MRYRADASTGPLHHPRQRAGQGWRAWLRGALSVVVHLLLVGCTDQVVMTAVPVPPAQTVSASVANVAPATSFAVSPRYPAPGDTVTVDGTYSHDCDGYVVSYRWEFGNGSSQITGAVAQTVFRQAGTYTIRLTTIDDSGDSTSLLMALPVSASGVPSNAVSAGTSTLSLSSASTSAGASITGTVTARTAAGAARSGVLVAMSTTGQQVRVTPPTALSDGSGMITSSLSSSVAQTVTVRAVADFTALVATAPLIITPSIVSPTRSALRVTRNAFATGLDSTLVEITVRDTAGNPVSGSAVALSASSATVALPTAGVTDAFGRWTGLVRNVSVCSGVTTIITAVASGTTLTPTASLTGTAPAAYGICGATFWLDATDTASTVLASGANINYWRDKSGRDDHAYGYGPPTQPSVLANGIHGRRAVRFDYGDYLVSNNAIQGIQRAVDVLLVAAPDSTSASYVFINIDGAGERFSSHLIWPSGSVYWDFGLCCGPSGRTDSFVGWFSPAFRPSVWGMNSSPVGAIQRQLRRDGVALSTGTTTDSLRLANRGLGIANNWDGVIGEMLIFPRSLTNTERASIERALMIKWGIGNVVIHAGNSQSTNAGTSPSTAPAVRITDDAGNALPGASVTFQVTSGSGRVNGATTLTVVTDVSGVAAVPAGQWIIDAGSNTLTAWYNTTAGTGTSATFTATGTFPANLEMRLDASDTTSLLSSSACTGSVATNTQMVGCWLDRSGNSTNATQPIATDRPVVAASGIAGKHSVSFTLARENWLGVTQTAVRNLRGTAKTMFAVANSGATESASTNFCSGVMVWPGYHNGLLTAGWPSVSVTDVRQWAQANGGAVTGTNNSNMQAYVPFVLAGTVAFTSATDFTVNNATNGVLSTPGTASDPTPGGATDLRIGQGNIAPVVDYRCRLDGQIGELLVFSRALTVTERQRVERYLGWKWGVTVP
jgi:PKD domain/Bacterial Ig-like domain (group 1)